MAKRGFVLALLASWLSSCISLPTDTAANSNSCQAVSEVLGHKVSYPQDAAYNASLLSYWSAQEEAVTPRCVVSTSSAQDVADALRVLVAFDCKFAVRSGGHGILAGIANIQGGVTIDMSSMNSIAPLNNNSVVALGPGARWGNIYSKLGSLGLSAPGGRVSAVAAEGLLTGGGFGWFAPQTGFGCDNVVEYEIVLANSSIITVSSASGHDLWRALKGGTNNFGIVTKFVVRTFALPDVWTANRYYPANTSSSQLKAFYDIVSGPQDVNAGLILNLAFSSSTGPLFTQQLAYAEPVQDPPVFKPFSSIKPQLSGSTGITTLANFSQAMYAIAPPKFQQASFATTFVNNLPMLQRLWTIFQASTATVANVTGIQWSLSLEPIVPAITAQSAAKGGNSLGLAAPPQGLVLCLLTATFNASNDQATVEAASQKLLADIIDAGKTLRVHHPYVDANHAGKGQDVVASYGDENRAFLQATARMYDPRGVFQTQCPGGFKVFPQNYQ